MKPELERELRALASAPLSVVDIEMLELEAIEVMMRPAYPRFGSAERDRARRVLRATAEIRKARGIWDAQEMSQREIDDEIAMLRGRS